mgnify:CR=1 FL=1
MKKIIFIILVLMCLSSCGPRNTMSEKNQINSDGISKENDINSSNGVDAQSGTIGLLFDTADADAQDMSPVFDVGTCSVKAELFEDEGKNYKGNIQIIREKPQAGYKDGYIKLEYDGLLKCGIEIEPDAKEALNKMAGGSLNGGALYGKIDATVRTIDKRFVEFPDFLEPMDYMKSYAADGEIPFLLSVDGEKAKIYLYFHKTACMKAEGELKKIPIHEAKKESNASEGILYINDKAMSSEKEGVKEIHRVLFIGQNSGINKYTGKLLYSMNKENTKAMGVYTKGNGSKLAEKDVEISFEPFDENKYISYGGTYFKERTAKPSLISLLNCEGQNFIFTSLGENVFVELPGTAFKGSLLGEFTEPSDKISLIAQESFAMYNAESDYYSSSDNSDIKSNVTIDSAMAGMNQAGIKLTEEQLKMMEAAIASMGQMPEGQSKWLPEGFMPMSAPMDGDYLEQPPSSVYGGYFQYQEDNLWIEDILPIYISKFSKMRDFKEKGGEVGGHKYHEMVFRYGENLIFIEFTDNAAGAHVSVMVY